MGAKTKQGAKECPRRSGGVQLIRGGANRGDAVWGLGAAGPSLARPVAARRSVNAAWKQDTPTSEPVKALGRDSSGLRKPIMTSELKKYP